MLKRFAFFFPATLLPFQKDLPTTKERSHLGKNDKLLECDERKLINPTVINSHVT